MYKKSVLMVGVMLVVGLIGVVGQEYIPTAEDIARFPKTKTVVVLENTHLSDFNVEIEDLMKNEWTLGTEYEFMKWDQAKALTKKKEYSFLLLNKAAVDKDDASQYLLLSLVLGGPSKGLYAMPDICSVPVAFYGVSEESYMYKIGVFFRFMQNHVRLLQADPSVAKENIFLYYNKNIQKLGDKTIYVLKEELADDVKSLAQIGKVYGGKVKIATKEDIEDAIERRDPSVVFLHKVGPKTNQKGARCFKILVGAADAQFYYFDWHKVSEKHPNRFLLSDFKKLNKKN